MLETIKYINLLTIADYLAAVDDAVARINAAYAHVTVTKDKKDDSSIFSHPLIRSFTSIFSTIPEPTKAQQFADALSLNGLLETKKVYNFIDDYLIKNASDDRNSFSYYLKQSIENRAALKAKQRDDQRAELRHQRRLEKAIQAEKARREEKAKSEILDKELAVLLDVSVSDLSQSLIEEIASSADSPASLKESQLKSPIKSPKSKGTVIGDKEDEKRKNKNIDAESTGKDKDKDKDKDKSKQKTILAQQSESGEAGSQKTVTGKTAKPKKVWITEADKDVGADEDDYVLVASFN